MTDPAVVKDAILQKLKLEGGFYLYYHENGPMYYHDNGDQFCKYYSLVYFIT